jgi:ankyrin repeat protein
MRRIHAAIALVFAVILAPALIAGMQGPPPAPPPPQGAPPAALELSYGEVQNVCPSCPDFRVTLRPDGQVTFVCQAGCLAGTQVYRVDPAAFTEWRRTLDAAQFFSVPREDASSAPSDRGVIVQMIYRDGGRQHDILRAGALPGSLAQVPDLVRKLTRIDLVISPSLASYRELVRLGWRPNTDALGQAVVDDDVDAVQYLLAQGAPPRASTFSWASHVDTRIADVLINRLKDDETGRASLLLLVDAAFEGETDAMKLLLGHGVDVNTRDPEEIQDRALFAAMYGRVPVEMTSFLLERGADPNAPSVAGRTPLGVAAAGLHDELIPVLVARGARINGADAAGKTPLMIAAGACAPWNVRALVAAGADASLKDKNGKTAREQAPDGSVPADSQRCQRVREQLEVRSQKTEARSKLEVEVYFWLLVSNF